jgi:phosphoglucosamine mutase
LHDEDIIKYIEDLNRENASGRILVRASGTEPKIRVMAEAESQAKCDKIVESIISIIREKGYIDE